MAAAAGRVGVKEPTQTLARRFWTAIEPIHAIVYFAPEPLEAARKTGLRGFWMSYFASRVAPLGPLPAPAVWALGRLDRTQLARCAPQRAAETDLDVIAEWDAAAAA